MSTKEYPWEEDEMSELLNAFATYGLRSPFMVRQNDTQHSVIQPRRP